MKRVLSGNMIELRSGEHVRISGLDALAITATEGEAAKRRLQRLLRRGTSIGLSDPMSRIANGSVRRVTREGRDVIRLLTQARTRRAAAPARAAAAPARTAAKPARTAAKPARAAAKPAQAAAKPAQAAAKPAQAAAKPARAAAKPGRPRR
ncbi:MAG: hypothetical protein EXR55_03545 [Dehalococcoidia bacterium]|nr:hypothetical protein [Dehalococcoidia bacterium]